MCSSLHYLVYIERAILNKTSKKKGGLEYIKSDDISLFLKVARQDNYLYYIFFKTLLETGMRKGEAAALQRKDIDLKNNYININKSLDFQVKEGEDVFGETKTYESERRIKISNSLSRELTAHMNYLNDNRIVFNGFMNMNWIFF
ncbi:site-specific integrase [Bacillus atrophaeus]|uniref:Phage integrase n=1 Tax=Bacillus atrophaeus (strain 1942) TaxID=720555 RepID=A0ABN3Z8U9_BACA1|nr:site-specific integrase [Bacillus atrophaeus]ADP32263.1 phage integrase [Bacillus atrophaeus 1942]AIK48579.1 phage integrase family protein [Bacillus atrophaeus subsp. globigii]EIM08895.1 phage integrase [Bacillus atrophaeus C89]KFK84456.1 phage integrase family protein [Bacillus atrophaeus]MEC1727712.1 site-specific integrase [Bacillus atrophaeus]